MNLYVPKLAAMHLFSLMLFQSYAMADTSFTDVTLSFLGSLPNNPILGVNVDLPVPTNYEIKNAIESYEECHRACFNLDVNALERTYFRVDKIVDIQNDYDRFQFGVDAMRNRGPWDFKTKVGPDSTHQDRELLEYEGNINYAIVLRRGFVAGDNDFLNLKLASRFSGAYNIKNKPFFTILKAQLDRPYGESSFKDILNIELAQDFDKHLAFQQTVSSLLGEDRIFTDTPTSVPSDFDNDTSNANSELIQYDSIHDNGELELQDFKPSIDEFEQDYEDFGDFEDELDVEFSDFEITEEPESNPVIILD